MPIIMVAMKDNVTQPHAHSDPREKMLSLIRAKTCQRCGGSLSLERDIYGIYIQCIQCGATWNRNDIILAAATGNERSLKVQKTKPPEQILVK
jgi:hypothetical protein